MHPILARRERLGLYLAAWLPLGGLLAATLVLAGGAGWLEAALLVTPLTIVYAFLCLAAWFPCRALPLRQATRVRALAAHLTTALVSAVAWSGMAWLLARLLERSPRFAGLAERVVGQVPLLVGAGVLLYLLSVAVHYLLVAFEASLLAERRAMQAEVAGRDAELQALKAQLNPHFLFNSLNSIASLTTVDAAQARQMCVELGDLLRGVLALSGRQRHPLADELALVRRYLAVERIRFGSRLQLVEEVEPQCLATEVPPLILQPLVENALKHGIGSLLEGGTLHLAARRAGSRLRLQVDNPVDPEAGHRPGKGMGLANVRLRLAAEYGHEANLHCSHQGTAYEARITLPAGTADAAATGDGG